MKICFYKQFKQNILILISVHKPLIHTFNQIWNASYYNNIVRDFSLVCSKWKL
jgi:hypothetical protein